MEKKYDVFISCKSEDYGYAEEVYNFLNSHGIHTFLASKELRKMGDSEYRNAIMQALESAYHLIIFASKPEYVDSKWVFYEWDTFVNAKLSGRKDGQIMTILKGFNTNKLRLDLIKYESFSFVDYKERLLSYVETPESQRVKELKRSQEKSFSPQVAIEAGRKDKHSQQKIVHQNSNISILKKIVDFCFTISALMAFMGIFCSYYIISSIIGYESFASDGNFYISLVSTIVLFCHIINYLLKGIVKNVVLFLCFMICASLCAYIIYTNDSFLYDHGGWGLLTLILIPFFIFLSIATLLNLIPNEKEFLQSIDTK